MNNDKTIELRIERLIAAEPERVFDAWLDPKVPGNPWHAAEKLLLNAQVDGLFYWALGTNAHYGRFTEITRPARLRCTWVSPSTLGLESEVTVSFEQQGENTRMTLVHTGLPDTDSGRGHERGWNYFLGRFTEQLGAAK